MRLRVRWGRSIYILLSALMTASGAASGAGMSLQEAIKLTLERNPRIQASDIRLRAQSDRTRAAWLAFAPNLNFGAVQMQDRDNTRSPGLTSETAYSSRGVSYGVSLNIFRGGSDYYSAQAAEKAEKALRARANSSTVQGPSSPGYVARQVMEVYTEVLRIRMQVEFYQYIQKVLGQILSATQSSDERNRTMTQLSRIGVALTNLNYERENADKDFNYIVKVPVPANMNSFDEVIETLKIPQNPVVALDVAMEKNQDLKASAYTVEGLKDNYRGQQGSTYLPRVDLTAMGSQRSVTGNPDMDARSNGTSVGVTMSWSFSPSHVPQLDAAAKDIAAAQLDHKAQIDDLEHNINSIYPELENAQSVNQLQNENLARNQQALDEILQKISASQRIDIQYSIETVSTLVDQWQSAIMSKHQVLQVKFRIQQMTGLLFENLGPGGQPAVWSTPIER